jgi:oligoribonuclease
MSKSQAVSKLFWIDMEMTGLDWTKERIIEVAAVITDLDFNELESYHAVVKQDQSYIEAMDDWNKRTHGESGLLAKIPHGKDPSLVEMDLMNLVQNHFQDEKPILAGNSISQDRLFIDEYMKSFSEMLHYRMLDVSSWKIIFNNKLKLKFEKKGTHKALDDIQESIAELKFYLKHVKV